MCRVWSYLFISISHNNLFVFSIHSAISFTSLILNVSYFWSNFALKVSTLLHKTNSSDN